MKSKTLAKTLNSWYSRQFHHCFTAHNDGITAAVCQRCGLMITVRGKIMDVDGQFFWLPYNDPSKRGYPAPHQLKKMADSCIPACGIVQTLEVMDS